MKPQADTYFQDLQNLANAQDKAKLATLAAEYAGVLSRLPALRAELENLLSGAQTLDYQRLLERYEPALQQASDWLFEVDRLPAELARDAQPGRVRCAYHNGCMALNLANGMHGYPTSENFMRGALIAEIHALFICQTHHIAIQTPYLLC